MSATTKKQDETKLPAVIDVSKYAIMGDGVTEYMDVVKENIGEITEKIFPRIKIPKGDVTVWQIGGELMPFFDGVIVDHTAHDAPRSYWREAYNGGNSPPDCFSDDGLVGIGDPGGKCRDCPYKEWGTKRAQNGQPGAGQACSVKRLVFLYRETDVVPSILIVTPGSSRAYRKYIDKLTTFDMRKKHTVVTRFGLTLAKSATGMEYAQLALSSVKLLSTDDAAKIKKMADDVLPRIAAIKREMTLDRTVMADAAI